MDQKKEEREIELPSTKSSLHSLLKHKEIEKLNQYFLGININDASTEEKEVFIKHTALSNSVELALIYIDKWNLKNNQLKVESYYLAGKYLEAERLISDDISPYLIADIYLAVEKYQNAIKVLQDLNIDENWFYYMGRCYSHLNELTKAQECLKNAIELSKNIQFKGLIYSNQIVLLSRMQKNKEALKASQKLQHILKQESFKNFPELKAKLLINNGLFLGNAGYSSNAIKNIIKAKIILNNSSNAFDFIRVNLTYAYNIAEIGYTAKAIATLLELNPTKSFQNFDKNRYLMKFYARFNDYDNFIIAKEKAQKYQDKSDPFDMIHFAIDTKISSIYLDKEINNDELINELCHKYQDEESFFYFQNHKNFLTLQFTEVETSLNYHLKKSLYKELNQDRILKTLFLYKNEMFREAHDEINRISHHANNYVLALAKIITFFINKKLNPVSTTWSSPKLTKFQDINFIYKYLNNADNLATYYNSLTPFQLKFVTRLSQILGMNLEQKTIVSSSQKDVSLTAIEKLDIINNSQKCLLDFSENSFYFYGVLNKKIIKSEIQLKLLKYMAKNTDRFLSKEEIVNNVFEKKVYDPVTDNNLIYVNINRLKKSLEYKDLILNKEGSYKLDNKDIFIIF